MYYDEIVAPRGKDQYIWYTLKFPGNHVLSAKDVNAESGMSGDEFDLTISPIDDVLKSSDLGLQHRNQKCAVDVSAIKKLKVDAGKKTPKGSNCCSGVIVCIN